MTNTILHAFDWFYKDIAQAAEEIARLGYGWVLFPPPLFSRGGEEGMEWWNRYQPKDYRVIRSYLGNKAELVEAIERLHEVGVKVIADVVFNHMANESRVDRLDFPGAEVMAAYGRDAGAFEADRLYGDLGKPLFGPADFNKDGNIDNWMDLHEATEHSLCGLPDLDMTDHVIAEQRECLRALNGLGFDGYRVDAVKHLPDYHIRMVFETEDLKDKFVFGESLTTNDAEERVFLWPLMEKTSLGFYDFPLHETLRRVFGNGGKIKELVDPAAFGQALVGGRGVTFSVTHDIPNNDVFRGTLLSARDEFLANVYILGRKDGIPLIYSDNDQSAMRFPEDMGRWRGLWRSRVIEAMLKFRGLVENENQTCLYEDDDILVIARGNHAFFAVNKGMSERTVVVGSGILAVGGYGCLLTGRRMEAGEAGMRLTVPARSGLMAVCR